MHSNFFSLKPILHKLQLGLTRSPLHKRLLFYITLQNYHVINNLKICWWGYDEHSRHDIQFAIDLHRDFCKWDSVNFEDNHKSSEVSRRVLQRLEIKVIIRFGNFQDYLTILNNHSIVEPNRKDFELLWVTHIGHIFNGVKFLPSHWDVNCQVRGIVQAEFINLVKIH